jgi:D-alanine-D-alanine ligase
MVEDDAEVTVRRVLILYGGRSSEHGVSCLSARSVLSVIDRDAYEVVPVGITREGRWVLTDGDIKPRPGRALPDVPEDGPTVSLVLGRSGPALVRFGDDPDRHELVSEVDVAFPVLHGPYGEDGTVQGLLATVGVPYVGADVTASSIGIDKRAAKNAFKAWGLPQGPYLPVRRERWDVEPGSVLDELEGVFDYPIFTKPARQGSSIGISKVKDRDSLESGLKEAFSYDRVAIVEESIEGGREIEVGVLGNAAIEVTSPGEIVPSHEFYDFEAKYLDASELIVPADLSEEVTERMKEVARRAYMAIGCRGMARIDFFVRRGNDGQEIFLNEINTIPGFTANSMFPRLWESEGLTYPELVDRLLELAYDAAEEDANYAP